MDIVILIFDDLTALDAIGPLEVLARLPDAKVRIVGKEQGTVRAGKGSGGLGLVADGALSGVERADILLVPGGFGTDALVKDRAVLDWVRAIHDTTTWTTSVCTGALVLAAAGLLDGLAATTHWAAMERLAEYGALARRERVVTAGKIVTAAKFAWTAHFSAMKSSRWCAAIGWSSRCRCRLSVSLDSRV